MELEIAMTETKLQHFENYDIRSNYTCSIRSSKAKLRNVDSESDPTEEDDRLSTSSTIARFNTDEKKEQKELVDKLKTRISILEQEKTKLVTNINLYRTKEQTMAENNRLLMKSESLEHKVKIQMLEKMIQEMKTQISKDVHEIAILKAQLISDKSLPSVPDLRCLINAEKMKSVSNIDDLAKLWSEVCKKNPTEYTLDESKPSSYH